MLQDTLLLGGMAGPLTMLAALAVLANKGQAALELLTFPPTNSTAGLHPCQEPGLLSCQGCNCFTYCFPRSVKI